MALRETVERLRSAREEPSDPHDIITRWQGEVLRLYDEITDWLKPFVEDGGIELKRQSKVAHEEPIGPYDIDQLDIDVGTETVRLDPKGAMVIGALGRIDMSRLGSGDPIILALTGADDQTGWSIVDRSVRGKLTPLTKDAFEAALDGLLAEYGTHPGSMM